MQTQTQSQTRGTNANLDELAHVIFIRNTRNDLITVATDMQTTKDCFCFCLDLLCKGLIILYGKDDAAVNKKKVDLDTLSIEQLDFIKGRLSLCGIKLNTRIVPVSLYDEMGLDYPKTQKIELPDLEAAKDTDPLDSYKIDIFTQGLHIQLSFSLAISAGQLFAHGCHRG